MSDTEQEGLSRRKTLARTAALAIGAYAAPALTTLSVAQAKSGSGNSGGGDSDGDSGGDSGGSSNSSSPSSSPDDSSNDNSSSSTCSGPDDNDAGCSGAAPAP